MPSMPLVVAAIAGALLVVVIGTDVAYNRTVYVDAAATSGQTASWTTVAQDPCCRENDYMRGPGAIEANRSDDIRFRLRVDNGYPIAYTESYVVRAGGLEVARGTLEAARGTEGTSEFTVPASAFLSYGQSADAPSKGEIIYCCGVEVEVDGKHLYVSPGIREVAK